MKRLENLTPIEMPSRLGPAMTLMLGEPVSGLAVTIRIDDLTEIGCHLPESTSWCATHLASGAAIAIEVTAAVAQQVVEAFAPLLDWSTVTREPFRNFPVKDRMRLKAVRDAITGESTTGVLQ